MAAVNAIASENDLNNCAVRYVQSPFSREPDFGVTSINYNWKELWERGQLIFSSSFLATNSSAKSFEKRLELPQPAVRKESQNLFYPPSAGEYNSERSPRPKLGISFEFSSTGKLKVS